MPTTASSAPLSLVALPCRLRPVLRSFRHVTGLAAVANLASDVRGSEQPPLIPFVHPRCAKRLGTLRTTPPCRHQWSRHLRSGRRSPAAHSHTCPIGLRCSCVPIHVNGRLVGIVKLVAGDETPGRHFAAATRLLSLAVSGLCQDSVVSALSNEVAVLRECVAELRHAGTNGAAGAAGCGPVTAGIPTRQCSDGRGLVDRAIAHLQRHYRAPGLSLLSVARTLGCNPKYLTTRFTRVVGERMHAYLVRLRVAQACQLLLATGAPIKQVAYSSGFRGNASLARSFRRFVGVPPGEYRRIFRDA